MRLLKVEVTDLNGLYAKLRKGQEIEATRLEAAGHNVDQLLADGKVSEVKAKAEPAKAAKGATLLPQSPDENGEVLTAPGTGEENTPVEGDTLTEAGEGSAQGTGAASSEGADQSVPPAPSNRRK